MLELSLSPDTPNHCKAALKGSMRYSLRVLSMLAPLVPVKDALSSLTRLKFLLSSFLLTPDLVGPAISALVSLTKHNDQHWTPSQIQGECSDWIKDLYRSCEESLTSCISNKSNDINASESEQECRIVRSLFTVGELSMIGFRSDEDSASMKRATSDDPIAGIYERPSNLLLNLSQSMLSKYLPKNDSDHSKQRLTPDAARAHAFIALGKLCLRDESLAKNCLNILARELHQNMDDMSPSVQSNALLVLGDLCVKYTNLVDRYLPVMAACLQSGNASSDSSAASSQGTALVRKHGVLMLSTLLLQDYIKWRGLLFHRFLVASADKDEGVAKLAEMTLCGPLLGRYPKLFFNNFVESLFVLNRCSAHPIYAAAASTGDNGAGIAVGFDGINLHGSSGRNSRIQMYKLMLSNMSDEEKIGVTARIAKEILGGALESNGDLGKVCRTPPNALSVIKEANSILTSRNQRDESAYNVLSDAFAILVSPSLKVGRVGTNNEEEIEESDANKPAQIAVAAKGKLLSKISRKHLIEIVLPILCNLKEILQESCSPLLRDLMRYIVEIFRVYKTEVKEFLASDPTLLQEVEYDARQFQKAQKAETPQRVLAIPVATA
uniref:Condensin complex subunit 1 C-terminal domain-containing protein n=1 Tax=Asterionellopsis glacialis TaxID=33640 RepID=A0A7S0PWK8_9STRA|mmetsp:Transcript_1969/g.2878  ORF Transcript_1969/g.2878 Transcript_1969/m.2878 type:complete len:608 (+) Transcript_1969:3-1826(+)